MSIEGISEQFKAYHAETKALATDVADLRETITAIERQVTLPRIWGDNSKADKAEAFKAFGKFVRTSDLTDFKNLSVSSDIDGGYLETAAVSDSINTKLFDASPMRGLINVVTMGAGSSWQEPIDVSDADANWVGESESRVETSAGNFGLVEIPLDECTALVKVTQRLLDDSRFDVSAYVINKLAGRFARLEDAAFVSGSGVKRPKGFLSYSTSSAADASRAAQTYQYVPSGGATAITADAILNAYFALRAPYRQSATWIMSSDTARQVRLLKDGNGQYLWATSMAAGTPSTLAGANVVIDENMPAVGAGTYPIALADWRKAYTAVERPGLKWLSDPYTAKPYIIIYATRRVGGQSSGDFDALKLMRIGTS